MTTQTVEMATGLRRLVVGDDNRLSTSKTAAVVWTYVVASALLSLVIAKWLGHPGALHVQIKAGLQGQYGILFGGPLGAAIAAKGITASQVDEDPTQKTTAQKPSASDLVNNDAGNGDLGDFQYVLFNFVALVFFFATFLEAPQAGLPVLPDVLLGLTSVSAVGYVTKKALPLRS